MSRPVHFEIHASDPARAIRFYERTFGWIFQQWGEQEYWLITTGSADEPGIDGGLITHGDPGGPVPVAFVFPNSWATWLTIIVHGLNNLAAVMQTIKELQREHKFTALLISLAVGYRSDLTP